MSKKIDIPYDFIEIIITLMIEYRHEVTVFPSEAEVFGLISLVNRLTHEEFANIKNELRKSETSGQIFALLKSVTIDKEV